MGARIPVTVTAHQLLHGYSSGHRLLATSTELPPSAQRALLIHSDAPAGPNGDRAIAALPLRDLEMWALTATWRAGEMSRPGSVWSHTLLLDRPAVSALRGSAGVLAALRRPDGPADTARYRRPVEIVDAPCVPAAQHRQLVEALLVAWYAWPDRETGVLTNELSSAEEALLAVWEQQWPALRVAASFAARARIDIDGHTAVQVAKGRSRAHADVLIIDMAEATRVGIPSFISELVTDVLSAGDLRDFLVRYAGDAPGDRHEMGSLVDLRSALRSEPRLEAGFDRLARLYPRPEQLPLLKRDLLEKGNSRWPFREDERILTAIAFHAHVAWTPLKVGMRLAAEWPQRADVVVHGLDLAWRSGARMLWTEVVDETARVADSSLVAGLADVNVPAAADLVRRRTDLLAAPSLWRVPAPWQVPLLEAVGEDIPQLDVARALVAGKAYETAATLHRQGVLSSGVLSRALTADGFSRQAWKGYREIFSDAIEQAAEAALERDATWTARAMAALVGPPHNPVVDRYADELSAHLDDVDRVARLPLAARLIAARPGGPSSHRVLSAAFPIVHRALVRSALPGPEWRQLDKVLPKGNHWDRAERLRRVLLSSIQQDSWSESEIADVIRRAGPEAERVRDLVKKKSDIGRVLDAALKVLPFT